MPEITDPALISQLELPQDKINEGSGITDPKLQESERTAAFLATRVAGSLAEIQAAAKADPSAISPTLGREAVRATVGQFGARTMTPAQRQIIEDAQINALDAALTLGTGAAYNREQLVGYAQSYFPQIGDKPETIAAKSKRFKVLLEAAKIKAGNSAPKIDEALAAAGILFNEAPPAEAPDNTQAPDGQHITASDRPYYSPPVEGGGQLDINKETMERVKDPALAGVAAQLNAMFKAGKGADEIGAMFDHYGIPRGEVMPAAMRILEWQRKNPNYKGDYNTGEVEMVLKRLNPARAAAGAIADTAFGASAIGTANAMTAGYLDELAPGDTDLNNMGKQIIGQRHPVATIGGNVLGGAAFGVGAMEAGAAAGIPMAGRFVAPAMDAGYGALYGSGEDNENRAMGALKGGVLGLAGGEIGRRSVNALGNVVSPTGGKLAPLYAEGVQPSIGQRLGASNALGRTVNRAEQAFSSVPLLGAIQRSSRNKAVTQMQTGAFNQALREIGTELPKDIRSGTAAHSFMQKSFDDAYDSARSGLQFKPDMDFATDFGQVLNDVDLLGADSQRAFEKLAKDVGNRLKVRGGTLNGDDYKLMVSRLDRKARAIRSNPSGDGELADALESMSAAMDNGARRISNPDAVALLDKADRGYAKAVIVEDAAKRRGGDAGEFSGSQLDAAVQNISGGRRSRSYLAGRANMQDYATAAKALGDSVPDSGTPERLMTGAAVLGGTGAASQFVSPVAAAPYVANTIANLPGVRTGVNAALRPRPSTRSAADAIRRRSYLGGLFGVPLAVESGQ